MFWRKRRVSTILPDRDMQIWASAKGKPSSRGQWDEGSFVRSSRLTKRPTKRRGQQGGNPPQAASSRSNVGRLCFLPSEQAALIAATHRTTGTPNDGTLPFIDETPDADHST